MIASVERRVRTTCEDDEGAARTNDQVVDVALRAGQSEVVHDGLGRRQVGELHCHAPLVGGKCFQPRCLDQETVGRGSARRRLSQCAAAGHPSFDHKQRFRPVCVNFDQNLTLPPEWTVRPSTQIGDMMAASCCYDSYARTFGATGRC